MTTDIRALDPAMASKPADTDGIAWHLPFEAPIKLLGAHWFDQDYQYHRLPLHGRPHCVTRFLNGVPSLLASRDCGAFHLSPDTAGMQLRFRTNSTKFLVQGTLGNASFCDHMPFTGTSGFDLYLKTDDQWICFGVTRFECLQADFSTTICKNLKKDMRDVIINFPLYDSVKSLSIGLDEDALIEAPSPLEDDRPIVFYGTSITQGGCATRPGMTSSNIMSRMLNREVINLGFSGNGRGEPEIARMVASVRNPAMFILDYSGNTKPPELAATLPLFIDLIREQHPDTPILLSGPSPHIEMHCEFASPTPNYDLSTEIMAAETRRRNLAGDSNVSFFNALSGILGEDFWECLVDGCHMTDMGFYRYSQAIVPVIRKLLK